MIEYREVSEMLDLPRSISRCIEGQIQAPVVDLEAPASWYGFPPALIPIWSEGSSPSYIGYWKHWFVDREPCFVQMHVEAKRLTTEIARTAEQLFCYVALTSIAAQDGVGAELERFAREVSIDNLDELDSIALESGDNPHGLAKLRQFEDKTPLNSVRALNEYTGTFPTGDFSGQRAWWSDCCSCELSREVLASWPSAIPRPNWLVEGIEKRLLFREYLKRGDLARAWLTLNSNGWSIADARVALGDLSDAAHNPAFATLAATWLLVADDNVGGY